MVTARSATLRAWSCRAQISSARLAQHPALKKHYSSTTDTVKKSSHAPWIAVAGLMTAGGTYMALQPRSAGHHDEGHHDEGHHAEKHDSDSGEDDSAKEALAKKKEALKDDMAKFKERLPKPEPDGESEVNHANASHANEHKVRKGKFSDVEFDNHDTAHSTDPGKDFEKIEKEEAKEEAKS